jgi:hypothetical protein
MIFEYSLLTIERIGIDMKTTPDLIRRTLSPSTPPMTPLPTTVFARCVKR